jgi:bacterioferritin-associated ferredoxin
MYVCLCKAITDRQVRELGARGMGTARELIMALGLDDEECCGFCMQHIGRLVAIANGGDPLTYGKFKLDAGTRFPIDDPDSAP